MIEPTSLSRALDLVRARGGAAQLCVLRDDEVILDHAVGCEPDSLFWIFSASKPYVALLVHLLVQRHELSLDDRVATHWPEFGRNGKETITIRQVLQHRSGLPVARGIVADALAMTRWDRAVHDVEQAHPTFPPGEVPAYHLLSYGVILGELVHRVTGVPVRDFLTTELLEPLGLHDTYLGLPRPLWSRHVPIRSGGTEGRIKQAFFNRRVTREAVVPAAGISTTARDLARFYQALLRGGEGVLDPATIAEAVRPSSEGEVDRFLHLPVRWSQGFQLGGPGTDPTRSRAMGQLSSPLAFGHNGSKCCIGWADPTRKLAVAYLTNMLPPGRSWPRHQSEVSDAILAALS